MSTGHEWRGVYECTMCDLGITWDGGFETWVHWWNGSIYCPDKTASVVGLPDELREMEPDENTRNDKDAA